MDQASALARVTVSLDFPSGKLDTFTVPSLWRDIKVYQNHAFIGAEASGHGMQVIDLTTLREFYGKDARGKNIRHLTVAEHYPEFGEARLRVFGGGGRRSGGSGLYLALASAGNSHNLAINEDSGFLYAIGSGTCSGGPHIVDIRDPSNPEYIGCVAEDGYTHE